ncbi:hypothetical protein ACLQ2Q_15710 [Microbacterium sp. DT81.1]|uniref:hypothetical protein n=1 Tax=Microbacterium sp. DT81.1 TaxID=3393413 RepID=UPI003CF43D60
MGDGESEWNARPRAVVEIINGVENHVQVTGASPGGAAIGSYYSRRNDFHIDGAFNIGVNAERSSFSIAGNQDGSPPPMSRKQRRDAKRASRKKRRIGSD